MNTPQNRTYGKKGRLIYGQSREIIANVIAFMKSEAELHQRTGQVKIPINSYKQRVIAATGISEKTYRVIKHEAEKVARGISKGFRSPRRKKDEDECENNPMPFEQVYVPPLLVQVAPLNGIKPEKDEPTPCQPYQPYQPFISTVPYILIQHGPPPTSVKQELNAVEEVDNTFGVNVIKTEPE